MTIPYHLESHNGSNDMFFNSKKYYSFFLWQNLNASSRPSPPGEGHPSTTLAILNVLNNH